MKRNIGIIVTIIISIFIICGLIYVNRPQDIENNNAQVVEENKPTNENEIINMLGSIAGVKANNIEIINNPVGFKGDLFVPKESILNGVDYFLKQTNNEKMKDLQVDIADGYISIIVDYKVAFNINTSVEVKISPTLNENEDLVLKVKEVRFLDIKVAKWIVDMAVDNFAKDWFPKQGNFKVEFNNGDIIIDKQNLKGVNLKEISVEEKGLSLSVVVDLNKVMN